MLLQNLHFTHTTRNLKNAIKYPHVEKSSGEKGIEKKSFPHIFSSLFFSSSFFSLWWKKRNDPRNSGFDDAESLRYVETNHIKLLLDSYTPHKMVKYRISFIPLASNFFFFPSIFLLPKRGKFLKCLFCGRNERKASRTWKYFS